MCFVNPCKADLQPPVVALKPSLPHSGTLSPPRSTWGSGSLVSGERLWCSWKRDAWQHQGACKSYILLCVKIRTYMLSFTPPTRICNSIIFYVTPHHLDYFLCNTYIVLSYGRCSIQFGAIYSNWMCHYVFKLVAMLEIMVNPQHMREDYSSYTEWCLSENLALSALITLTLSTSARVTVLSCVFRCHNDESATALDYVCTHVYAWKQLLHV